MNSFISPIKDDSDASFLATLHVQGLLPEPLRANFVQAVRSAALQEADASFLEDDELGAVLTKNEHQSLLRAIEEELMPNLSSLVTKLSGEWDSDYPPDEHFDKFESSIKLFSRALSEQKDYSATIAKVSSQIREEITKMHERFEPPSSTSAPTSQSTPPPAGLSSIFRDIDE